jgi:hypothetical protein
MTEYYIGLFGAPFKAKLSMKEDYNPDIYTTFVFYRRIAFLHMTSQDGGV